MKLNRNDPPPDYVNAKGYADAWGYRLGSPIANLIDWLREERRYKYATDYRLVRVGKNRYTAIAGDLNSCGCRAACENAQRFGTVVTLISEEGD